MHDKKFRIIGIGEVILDDYPAAGEYAGGVPTNYIRHVNRLGFEGILVSRIGKDNTGTKLIQMLQQLAVETKYIQQDDFHPTARIQIEIGDDGQPVYKNGMPVAAYDFLSPDPALDELFQSADAIVFTALGQRNI
ncbi:hypothetical protein JW964_05985, partial [candidate division KSB1 bacterium]|nr:hypothetical protein [candidate division KSB1 bacterium]